jgi:uncharacterized protein (DUF488 family)
MDALSTIGYEGASLAQFLGALRAQRADLLLDVREAPVSRRPEFARKALAAALTDAGMAYRHQGRLGAPKPLRERLKQGGCSRDEFFAAYAEHLDGQRNLLDALVAEPCGHVVLMCYERDVRECHRSVVARALEQRAGLTAQHLVPGRHEDGPQGELNL